MNDKEKVKAIQEIVNTAWEALDFDGHPQVMKGVLVAIEAIVNMGEE